MKEIRYVALLRGINVGGNKKVPMAELKKAFESLDFHDVKTLLNSGNVIFDSSTSDILKLTKQIEDKIKEVFGFEVGVIIRQISEIHNLIHSDPFKKITVTPETRLYVTFLSEKPTSTLKIPYESPDKDFKIIHCTNYEVCSVLTLSEKTRTVDSMKILENEYGKKITTRNWNTVKKIVML